MTSSLFWLWPMASPSQDRSPGGGNKTPRSLADYQPRTLAAIAQAGLASKLGTDPLGDILGDALIIQANVLPSRVQVIYDGEARPLEGLKKDVLDHWTRRYAGNPLGYTESYQVEVRVFENDRPYWVAVRTQDIQSLQARVSQDRTVELYVIGLGGAKSTEGDSWEWLYLVVPTPTD
ncbi:hypothetical protein L3556_07325 [Candidatus Synechococcus calcipolaris G9]|uniref:Uncharacterized protein n=1 Tax=Candidatus Synechococcus calcipolaris G9 TaxID=1497997 RepID=A0ABT6EZ05_9SYNE|nr:hypothetical protein [Candidatus Synechococcus calcipolaris]MDG2990741.1 hypothetical protein [Candidatus Synechococcus calcipolaris G9]